MKLICEHLTKAYSGREVLRDVSLTLEQGKIYGLIGRNGAGKTTLLSALTAQIPITAGAVTLDGAPVWENRGALKELCFSRELNISSESGLSSMKVRDYLHYAAIYCPRWDEVLAQRLIGEFQLPVKKRLGKLSKGMLSMVTIVVALASKAPFTFLDEPVAGLDVIAREQFYRLLIEEYQATGRTFVVSTHILSEAANVLEEVIILRGGELLTMTDTESLLNSARYVTGRAEDVDAATAGLEVHHGEVMGRSKAATVFLREGQTIREGYDLTVQPMSLQQVFVALCGEEENR